VGILRTTGRAAAVVAAVVALLGVLSVLGLLDRVAWVFLLAGVFRLQYIVVLCGAALLALALGRIRLASIAAALAALNMVAIGVPLTAPATAAHGPTTGSLRLLIANVEVGNHRAGAVERLIERVQPDVVGIVELTPEMAGRPGRSLPGYRMRRIVPRDDAYGIGLYSRVPLDSARVARFPSDGGPPTVIARARVAGKPVTVVVTHVHTPFAGSIHVRHLEALGRARSALGRNVAICGDFNTVPWSRPFRRLASDARMTELYGDDAWSGYSWPTWTSVLRVPLDNCLVSHGLAVTDHRHGPDIGSDHFPLVVDLALTR
jgi:endonuclease/exonuclease/phosphatase (EEP) superfamily protein YafD